MEITPKSFAKIFSPPTQFHFPPFFLALSKIPLSSTINPNDINHTPLQAVLLADSFATKFRPNDFESLKNQVLSDRSPEESSVVGGVEIACQFAHKEACGDEVYRIRKRWRFKSETFTVSIELCQICLSILRMLHEVRKSMRRLSLC